MKICYLASAASIHTRRWASHFAEQGHQVEIISFETPGELDSRVKAHVLRERLPKNVECFVRAPYVRKLLRESKPDIVHAHYASSYGTLGTLCGLHPYVLSVWGSDVYEFPNRSRLHRELLKRNLSRADEICSTSKLMAEEVRKYCDRPVAITPFGIDCTQFRPQAAGQNDEFVVGTVKTLEPVYGIEYLIRAFALFKQRLRTKMKVRLVIAGDGYLRTSLEKLASDLGVATCTEFMGAIPHADVPNLLTTFSVFANLSESESFGVAPLEASACGLPVVASDAGNLPEIVRNGVTGIIVPRRDPEAAANAFETLAENEELRESLGMEGRRSVLTNYDWAVSTCRMESVYAAVVAHQN